MCGNVTILGRLRDGEVRAFPRRARDLLTQMLGVSQIRGSQSGGGAVQVRGARSPRQVIAKCLNSKRGNLAARMAAAIARRAGRSRAANEAFLVQTHVRFATSGVSSAHEAHPFRFVDVESRGPRRVMKRQGARMVVEQRPIETALTHNGDMDGLTWRGQRIPFPDLGYFLEHILGVDNRWVGDSPQLSAAIELFLTRGMWLESFRLAFHVTAAPRAPDFSVIQPDIEGAERARAAKELLKDYPAPGKGELLEWAALAEAAMLEHAEAWLEGGGADRESAQGARDRITEHLTELRSQGHFAKIPERRMRGFARAAVDAFFDNDLYVAVRKLEPALLGTFGCVVTSTLEPSAFVTLSRGQPLSIGFQRTASMVAVASERAALKVVDAAGDPIFEERLDMDFCHGEIARVGLEQGGKIHLTLYGISDGRERTSAELQTAGRVVPLSDNPYVSKLRRPAEDRVNEDLEAVGSLCREVRASFHTADSHNARTAAAFTEALFRRMRPRLLVLGVTNDLWLSQQFVQNFKRLFPAIPARAISSNAVLREPESVEVDRDTVVLAVSHSGQDFPTLGALLVIGQRLGTTSGESLFIMTGEVDSLMGQAVGQQYASGARFSQRIFVNHAGFRPTEAAVASVSAMHHCLVQLLLSLARQALDDEAYPAPPYGLTLTRKDLAMLERHGDACIKERAPVIARGVGESRTPIKELGRQATRWKWHVLEGVVGFSALVLLLELNLQLHLGIVPSTAVNWIAGRVIPRPDWLDVAARVIGGQLDVAFYVFLAPLAILLMRFVQRRSTMHRHGLREVLIGDTEYVHRIAWLFARKLFSLSYGFASIKPYSADCQDELIMTHEPVRGSLVLIGVPDHRRKSLRPHANAALMTARQFDSSRSLAGAGAEIVTVGHSPAGAGKRLAAHIALPTPDADESSPLCDILCEGLFDSWERLLAMQVFLNELARPVAALGPARYDRSRTKDQVFAPTTAAPVSAAAIYQLLSRSGERYEQFQHLSLPFDIQRSSWRVGAHGVRTTVWNPTEAADGTDGKA